MKSIGYSSVLQQDHDHLEVEIPCEAFRDGFPFELAVTIGILLLVALAMTGLAMWSRGCEVAQPPDLETAYRHIEANPIDEFAGLPAESVFANGP